MLQQTAERLEPGLPGVAVGGDRLDQQTGADAVQSRRRSRRPGSAMIRPTPSSQAGPDIGADELAWSTKLSSRSPGSATGRPRTGVAEPGDRYRITRSTVEVSVQAGRPSSSS
jgi:hypothetical protein